MIYMNTIYSFSRQSQQVLPGETKNYNPNPETHFVTYPYHVVHLSLLFFLNRILHLYNHHFVSGT